MLWLCLHLPRLPLEIFSGVISNDHGDDASSAADKINTAEVSRQISLKPTAVVSGHRIEFCNPAALAYGITPDLTLGTAYSLCPDLHTTMRDTVREQLALQHLAYGCYRFTSTVCVEPPDNVLLEIQGSLKLFGGVRRLCALIEAEVAAHRYSYVPGLAPTPAAAQLISRGAINPVSAFDDRTGAIADPAQFKRVLHALPLSVLNCAATLQVNLHRTGLRQFGDLLRLPAAALGKRCGQRFLHYLQQVTGQRPDVRKALQLPPQFDGALDFMTGLISTEMLLFPMRRLLLALCGYLYARQLHCGGIEWRLQQQNGVCKTIVLSCARPRNDADYFLSLTRLKLEPLTLDAPVENIALSATELHPARYAERDLLAPHRSSTGSANSSADATDDLVDRLCARLGASAISGLALADSHIPEHAWQSTRPSAPSPTQSSRHSTRAPVSDTETTPSTAPHRPAWLLSSPAEIQRRGQQLYWRGALQLLHGPERIEGEWWHKPVHRDYFIARHPQGAVYWIYRELNTRRWFVHGIFS